MRKLFYTFGLASALVFALVEPAAVPNFAGTWTLDKSKSQELALQYKTYERIAWNITQTDNDISIEEAFNGVAIKDLPPVRLGIGGPGKPIGPRTYNVDGSETIKNIGEWKLARKAILSNNGKTLELVDKLTGLGFDSEFTWIITDKLSLSADGKVLTVIRSKDGSPAPEDSTLVFNK